MAPMKADAAEARACTRPRKPKRLPRSTRRADRRLLKSERRAPLPGAFFWLAGSRNPSRLGPHYSGSGIGHRRRGDPVTVPRHRHGGPEGYASPRTRFDYCAASSFLAASPNRVNRAVCGASCLRTLDPQYRTCWTPIGSFVSGHVWTAPRWQVLSSHVQQRSEQPSRAYRIAGSAKRCSTISGSLTFHCSMMAAVSKRHLGGFMACHMRIDA
jgi:hypothetical protein